MTSLLGWAILVQTAFHALPVVGQSADSSANVLRPGDIVRISVWPAEELGGDFSIEDSGFVYLPMLGEVRAAGVALDELRADLRTRLGEALKTPVVTVTPIFKVSVLGGVVSPGLYPMESSQTILDAISVAGGFTRDSDRQKIGLIRDERTFDIDAEAALEVGGGALNLTLRSGDRVIVATRGGLSFSTALAALQTVAILATLFRTWS